MTHKQNTWPLEHLGKLIGVRVRATVCMCVCVCVCVCVCASYAYGVHQLEITLTKEPGVYSYKHVEYRSIACF